MKFIKKLLILIASITLVLSIKRSSTNQRYANAAFYPKDKSYDLPSGQKLQLVISGNLGPNEAFGANPTGKLVGIDKSHSALKFFIVECSAPGEETIKITKYNRILRMAPSPLGTFRVNCQ